MIGILADDHSVTAAVRAWLSALERCVRAVDYAAARPLFAPDVQAFGTYAAIIDGREALERDQWRHVWPTIREFTFRLADLRCAGNCTVVAAIVPWDSCGVRADGSTYARPGRATLLLVRRSGGWVALHSHFSLAPSRD